MVLQILIHTLLNAGAAALPPEGDPLTRVTWIMGTRFGITVEGLPPSESRRISEAVLREVERVDALLNTWDDDSDLARANRAPAGTSTPLPPEVTGLLQEAFSWSHGTENAFDPAVGALLDAWDLRGQGRIPDLETLAAARSASGPARFHLDADGTLLRHHPDAWIDAGGFGKGAALRTARNVLMENLAVSAIPASPRILLDLGGQIWASGSVTHPWRIQVAHPGQRGVSVAALSLRNASVATSGTSERWVEVDGIRLGHILDPRTGFPAPPWGSVTVVAEDPMEADILATALYVMGPEEGLSWAHAHPGIGALFLATTPDGLRVSWSSGMERWLSSVPVSNGAIIRPQDLTTTIQEDGIR